MESLKSSWQRRLPGERLGRWLVPAVLAFALLLGGYFRLAGNDWDAGQHLHPDERFITMVATAISFPKSLGEYFDTATSPLNPYNKGFGSFVYGTFPLFLTKALAKPLDMDNYGEIHLLGRFLSGLFELGTVLLVYFIGRDLYGRRVGLLAALLYAFTVFSIQVAHFFATDSFTVFFVALTFYFAVRVQRRGRWQEFLGMGLAFGLAVASKVSVAWLVLVMAGATAVYGYRLWREGRQVEGFGLPVTEPGLGAGDVSEGRTWSLTWRWAGVLELAVQAKYLGWRGLRLVAPAFEQSFAWARPVALLALAGFVGALVFRILQPYAFVGLVWPSFKWIADIGQQQKFVEGVLDYPPSIQYAFTPSYWFPFKDIVIWGMGVPLGLVAWAGFGLAVVQLFRGQLHHLIAVLWIAFNFWYYGDVLAKGMRYFYPMYPVLIVLGAYFLFWTWDRARASAGVATVGWRRLLPAFGGGGIILVVLATFLYAVAFTSIYRQPVTRVAASEWVYENIPPGAAVANEHWDDGLPLNLSPTKQPGLYKGQQLPLYDPDTPEKLRVVEGVLNASDYIFITSNRLYASIPRMPMRYPMGTEYYRLLFDGQLGFELVANFTSYPKLFGLEMNDDRGMGGWRGWLEPDEAFTVYDHPKVLIFKKLPTFSVAAVHEQLSRVAFDEAVNLTPRQAEAARGLLRLSPGEWQAAIDGGTWSAMFSSEGWVNEFPLSAITWILLVELLGLIAFPMCFVIFRGLADRGYGFAKALGILLLAYLSWLLPSLKLLPFTQGTIALMLLVLLVIGGLVFRRWRFEIAEFVRQRWRWLVTSETVFLGLFALFYIIRRSNPDLWHPVMGGEKPMDFAYLNAVIRSTYFPPYDPWFAGGYINYYYFGQVVVATLTKLVGILPSIAYNLAVPLVFALTGASAFAVVTNVLAWVSPREGAQRWVWSRGHALLRWPWLIVYGLAGAVFAVLIGNLGEAPLVARGLWAVSGSDFRSNIPGLEGAVRALVGVPKLLLDGQLPQFRIEWWYWNATRVISNTINEFPFFTFLYGDLHAHAIALPFTVLALGLGLALWGRAITKEIGPAGRWGEWATLVVLALAVGALYPLNTWDYPTYLLLGAVLIGFQQYTIHGNRIDWAVLGRTALRVAFVFVLGILFFYPFRQSYGTAYSSFELWSGERTGLTEYLVVHGFFLFILASFVLFELFGSGTRSLLGRLTRFLIRYRGHLLRALGRLDQRVARVDGLLLTLGVASMALLVVIGLVVAQWWVFALGVSLLALSLFGFVEPEMTPDRRLVFLLTAVGLALTLGVEVVVLQGDIGRMNTVFKFYLQVWVLFALASALALPHLVGRLKALRWPRGDIWWAAFALLVVAVLLYPVAATAARMNDRFDRFGPADDGAAYMSRAVWIDKTPMELRWDADAMQWLLENVSGSPVILEGNGRLYSWFSRVSVYTGLPTVAGWDWHQRQQRGQVVPGVVERRLADVQTLYTDPSPAKTLQLFERYRVQYIYVGDLERAYYPAPGLAKFDQMVGSTLDIVYTNDHVKIYRVREQPNSTS